MQSPPDNSNRFLQVKEWVGTFIAEFKSSHVDDYQRGSAEFVVHGSVKFDKKAGVRPEWTGDLSATVNVSKQYIAPPYQGSMKGSGLLVVIANQPYLEINRNTYTLDSGLLSIHGEAENNLGDGVMRREPVQVLFRVVIVDIPLPETGLQLTGTRQIYSERKGNQKSWFSLGQSHEWSPGLSWIDFQAESPAKITWDLAPVTEPVELVVAPEDYEHWLPTGGKDELTPGNNPLRVLAKLQTKNATSYPPIAKRLKFELVDVSHEPGVSINYPPPSRATGDVKDLQFDPKRNPKLIVRPTPPVPQGSQQTAETPEGEYSEAVVVISPYDFGAWGILKVTAYMANGSSITGHLKGDPKSTEILLPKRQISSKIADAWKQEKNVTSLPDDDDSENDPVGDGYKGDGLTLYEKYRGFHENGEYKRGDPTKKEFFVLNEIGTRAEMGISIFADVTRLKVHPKLKEDELGDDRTINCNYGYAHLVDQHAVRLKRGDLPFMGGEAQGGPGTPKSIEEIVIHMGTGLGSKSSRQTFDQVIGHELLHSVNVWHHGEKDIGFVEWKKGTHHGKPVVTETRLTSSGEPTNVVQPVKVYQDEKEIPPEKFTGGLRLWVAQQGGQHSGNLACLMRYNVASAYVRESHVSGIGRRQWVPEQEKEPAGLKLCTAASGTIRYGDAAQDETNGPMARGDCLHKIRVSDL